MGDARIQEGAPCFRFTDMSQLMPVPLTLVSGIHRHGILITSVYQTLCIESAPIIGHTHAEPLYGLKSLLGKMWYLCSLCSFLCTPKRPIPVSAGVSLLFYCHWQFLEPSPGHRAETYLSVHPRTEHGT